MTTYGQADKNRYTDRTVRNERLTDVIKKLEGVKMNLQKRKNYKSMFFFMFHFHASRQIMYDKDQMHTSTR